MGGEEGAAREGHALNLYRYSALASVSSPSRVKVRKGCTTTVTKQHQSCWNLIEKDTYRNHGYRVLSKYFKISYNC